MQHRFVARFSSWKSWYERDSTAGNRFPGIYALAISKKPLAGLPFAFLQKIAYFGMTNSASGLRGRLKQFDNTIRGRSGHGGADRFRHDFPMAAPLERVLYVSVMPIECSVTSHSPVDLLATGPSGDGRV